MIKKKKDGKAHYQIIALKLSKTQSPTYFLRLRKSYKIPVWMINYINRDELSDKEVDVHFVLLVESDPIIF